jgi:hypothetical protein
LRQVFVLFCSTTNLFIISQSFSETKIRICLFHPAQTVSTRPPVVAAAIAAGKGAAPMFVQFVMEPLCAIYREILVEQNLPKMQKMIERLELKIPARDLMSKEFRPKLQARVM